MYYLSKIKLVISGVIGLSTLSLVQADVIDDVTKELKEKGIDVKIEEKKVQVYSHDELERKQKNEAENRIGEVNRAKNVFGKYLQQNRQVDHVKENNTKNNVDINRANESIKAENERLFKNWEEEVARVREVNNKLSAKYEKDKAYVEGINRTLKEEYDKLVELSNKDKNSSSLDIAEQIKKIRETNARIEKENADRRTQVDKENARRKEVNANNAKLVNNYKNDLVKYIVEKARIEKENQETRNRNAARQAEYEKNVTKVNSDYEKAVAKYNQDKAKYEAEKAKHDSEKAKYDADSNKHTTDLAKYNEDKAQYEKDKDRYIKDKEKYDKDYAEWLKNKDKPKTTVITSSNAEQVRNAVANNGGSDYAGELASGNWNNRRPVVVGGDIYVSGNGTVRSKYDLEDPNGSYTINAYSASGKLRDDNVIVGIDWNSGKRLRPYNGSTIVDGDMIQAEYESYGRRERLYDTSSGGTTIVQSVKSGQWFLVPDAVKLKNGERKGLWVKLTKRGNQLMYGSDWFTVWNANGAINYYNGANPIGKADADVVDVEYRVEDEKDYLWATSMIDLDGGQYLHVNYGGRIISSGGGISVDGQNAESNEGLGYTFGINRRKVQALDGLASAPDGIFTYVTYGKSMGYTMANTKGGNSTAIANGDFGTNLNINIVTTTTKVVEGTNIPEPTSPKEPVEPVKPSEPIPPKSPVAPVKPDTKPEVKKPEVEPEKPLPKEPVEPKVVNLDQLTPVDRPPMTPPFDEPGSPFKPMYNPLPMPEKPELKPEPVKPNPLKGVPNIPPTVTDGGMKPSIVLKRTIFEYLNTSTGISSNVRKLGKASYGNSKQIRTLGGNKLSFGNSLKVDKL